MRNDLGVKGIYFNCFDTWLEIVADQQHKWALNLFQTLNIDSKKIRNLMLTSNVSLRQILQDQVPYIFDVVDSPKLQALQAAEEAISAETAGVILKPGAATTMQQLKERGYAVGIISNISQEYVPAVNKNAPIAFDFPIYSCEVGFKKTIHNNDYRIYEHAQKLMGLKKREIVMIGDHEENDYQAAVDYGFHAIHMDRNKTNKAPRGQRVYVMEELLDIFE